jgi:1-deoxy-D-xylulose-5-phosphate reductoisomerase
VDTPIEHLDLAQVGRLTFERPDTAAFPCLELAREAAGEGGTAPCTLNAANEIAVHAFLGRRIAFMDIPRVIEGTLESVGACPVRSFDDLYEADADARGLAAELVERLAVTA